jgi:hypothetical protein
VREPVVSSLFAIVCRLTKAHERAFEIDRVLTRTGRGSAAKSQEVAIAKTARVVRVYPLTIVAHIAPGPHGGAPVDRYSVFMTAFWAGLASPGAVYASTPQYRPQICDLTFFAPFAVAGELISLSLRDSNAGRQEPPDRSAPEASQPEQLSLSFE